MIPSSTVASLVKTTRCKKRHKGSKAFLLYIEASAVWDNVNLHLVANFDHVFAKVCISTVSNIPPACNTPIMAECHARYWMSEISIIDTPNITSYGRTISNQEVRVQLRVQDLLLVSMKLVTSIALDSAHLSREVHAFVEAR